MSTSRESRLITIHAPEIVRGDFHIYLADDDNLLNELVKTKLGKAGFNLQVTTNGKDMLALMEGANGKSLLLLDYMLPDMDGKELIHSLLERRIDIPFVVVTGYGDEKLAVDLMKLGARDYIVKDSNYLTFLPETLDRVIKQITTETNLDDTKFRLKEAEAKFLHLFQRIPEPVFISDPQGVFLDFNQALSELLSLPVNVTSSLKIQKFFEFETQYQTLIEAVGKQRNIKDFEVRLVKENGERIDCLLSALAFGEDENQQPGLQGIFHDITESKQAVDDLQEHHDQLQERNLELVEMATSLRTLHDSITNDLRAPLWRIDGFCEALYDKYEDVFDETGKKYLEQVHKDSRRITQFVNDAISLSKVADSTVLRSTVDLSALAYRMFFEIEKFSDKGDIQYSVEEGLKAEADSPLLTVLLRVLINNAWDLSCASENGFVKFFRDPDYENTFKLDISGVNGVDLEQVDCFVPFYEPAMVKDFDYTGVGLITVQRIVNLHGGKIWKDLSREGVYTVCFTLSPQ